MPRLAIVISAVGSVESLEGTLASVLEHRPADCEIVVALDRPYADPYELKGEVRFVEAPRGAGLVGSIDEALRTIRAPFVHLLASGCTVSEGWTEPALARFGQRRVAAVAPWTMEAGRPERIFAAGLGYRRGGRRYLIGRGETALGPAELSSTIGACGFAAFYRRAALDLCGGLSWQLGIAQADVDLALTLRQAGFCAVVEPKSRVLAGPEVEASESVFRRALHEERLFWRNLPEDGRARAIVAHLVLVGLEAARGFLRPAMILQLAGRVLACCQLNGYARHRAARRRLELREGIRGAPRQPARIDASHAKPALSRAVGSRQRAN